MFKDLKKKVLKVSSTRVWRTYFGGMELERWLGTENPRDGDLPENWIASIVKARNPGREHITDEGLSKVKLETEEIVNLKDIIDSDPAGFLGKEHFEKYGNNMGILAKIIDSLNRLTIQVHPDKAFAKQVLASDYGKTEAWYILGGRKVNGEEPYVLLGFKPEVTREKWKNLFEIQDIEGMLNCLNKIYVKPGEVYFIEGGVPHAIGSGCFLIELQEPTDFTLRTERKTPEGREISEQLCHQGAGFEKLFDCFHYDGLTKEQVLSKWCIPHEMVNENEDFSEYILIGENCTKLFNMKKVEIRGSYEQKQRETFSIVVVAYGEGKLEYDQGSFEIIQGEFLFIPAMLYGINWKVNDNSKLEIIQCIPPI